MFEEEETWMDSLDENERKIVVYAIDTIKNHGTTPVIGHHYLKVITTLAKLLDAKEAPLTDK